MSLSVSCYASQTQDIITRPKATLHGECSRWDLAITWITITSHFLENIVQVVSTMARQIDGHFVCWVVCPSLYQLIATIQQANTQQRPEQNLAKMSVRVFRPVNFSTKANCRFFATLEALCRHPMYHLDPHDDIVNKGWASWGVLRGFCWLPNLCTIAHKMV